MLWNRVHGVAWAWLCNMPSDHTNLLKRFRICLFTFEIIAYEIMWTIFFFFFFSSHSGSYSKSPSSIPIQNGGHYHAPSSAPPTHIPYSHSPHEYSNHHPGYGHAPPVPHAYPVPSRPAHYGEPSQYHPAGGSYEYSSGGGRRQAWNVGGGLFDPVNPQYGAESAEQAMGRKWKKYFGGEVLASKCIS